MDKLNNRWFRDQYARAFSRAGGVIKISRDLAKNKRFIVQLSGETSQGKDILERDICDQRFIPQELDTQSRNLADILGLDKLGKKRLQNIGLSRDR